MKTWGLVGFGILFLAVVGYFGRIALNEYRGGLDKVDRALFVMERIQPMLDLTTARLDSLRVVIEEQKELEDSLLVIAQNQRKEIAELEEEITQIPDPEIPEPVEGDPADYEECVEMLEGTRVVNDLLRDVIEYRDEKIVALEAVNKKQGIVMDMQEGIIKSQRLSMEALAEGHDDLVAYANRRAFAGVLIGTATGVAFVVIGPVAGTAVAVGGVVYLIYN